jgi:antirestriction protein ArdC
MSTRERAPTEDKLEALHNQLAEAVVELASSDGWQRMLTIAARFHDYSPSNILLIGAQRPDATRVAGFRTWLALGRHVTNGEHGIAILAPCVYKADDAGPRADPSAPGRAADPAAVTEADQDAQRVLRGFKVVHVFDISQTDGEPLPTVEPAPLDGEAPQRLTDHLTALTAEAGYRLERGPCRGANGYTDFAARVVRVIDTASPAQFVKTLAHELGHIRADHEHRFNDYATSIACRGQAEIEAESIAYLVTARAGLDASAYSVPYLAGWAGGDVDLLRESMTRVVTVARAIAPPVVEATPALWPTDSVTPQCVSTSLTSSAASARAL